MSEIRKGMPDVQLTRQEFDRRFRERFADPAFASLDDAIGRIADAAWNAYHDYRKAPHTRKAGQGYADPDYDLSADWIAASRAVKEAEERQRNPGSPPRILLSTARHAASTPAPERRQRPSGSRGLREKFSIGSPALRSKSSS